MAVGWECHEEEPEHPLCNDELWRRLRSNGESGNNQERVVCRAIEAVRRKLDEEGVAGENTRKNKRPSGLS